VHFQCLFDVVSLVHRYEQDKASWTTWFL